MKLLLMPKELSWWIWTTIALLLLTGLAGLRPAFIAAILLSGVQAVYYLWKLQSWSHYAVQVRVAYTLLMLVCFVPSLHWLYWLPALGTAALVTVGYCVLSRALSLMPWKRSEPFTPDLLRRTFLTPPVVGRIFEPITDTGCPGGVCVLEARASEVYRRQTG